MRIPLRNQIAAVLVGILVLLVGCSNPVNVSSDSSESAGSSPGDSINDAPRVYAASAELGGFDYDSMPAVRVKLAFVDSNGEAMEGAVATLQTENRARVYRGRSNAEGVIETEVSLPSAPEDITLLVERPGFQSRRMVIEEMVRYETIDRRLEVRRTEGGVSAQRDVDGPASILSSADSDSDGVPDKLDDFPYDPERAFRSRVPAEGMITVAFEDLYPRYDPDDPRRFFDADFNDFVARYAIEEITNSEGELVELKGKVHATERLAAYDHLFGMLFRFEGHSAEVHIKGPDGRGFFGVQDYADVVLFESTRQFLSRGYRAGKPQTIPTSFTITFDAPVPRNDVTKAPYDPYIKVHDTGEYIHRIGMEPHPYAPPSEGDGWNYRHPTTGMPWALIIPQEDWIYPGDQVFIEDVYPGFRYWRESFGEHYPDWYAYYKEDPVPPVITAIEPDPTTEGRVVWPDSEIYELQLEEYDELAGELYYRAIETEDELPEWLDLDETEGKVTVDPEEDQYETAMVRFYSSYNENPDQDEESRSTIDFPLAVEFRVGATPDE